MHPWGKKRIATEWNKHQIRVLWGIRESGRHRRQCSSRLQVLGQWVLWNINFILLLQSIYPFQSTRARRRGTFGSGWWMLTVTSFMSVFIENTWNPIINLPNEWMRINEWMKNWLVGLGCTSIRGHNLRRRLEGCGQERARSRGQEYTQW